MSLFSFGNITFNKGNSSIRGPLAELASSKYQTSYLKYPLDIGNADKGHYMVFYIKSQSASSIPEARLNPKPVTKAIDNIAFDAKSQINKNVTSLRNEIQKNFSQELSSKINNGLNDIQKSAGGIINDLSSAVGKTLGVSQNSIPGIGNIFGQTNTIISGSSAATQENIDRSISSLENSGNIIGSVRKTKRTETAVALYMPDTLQFSYNQNYQTLTPGQTIAGQLAGAGVSSLNDSNIGAISALKSAAEGLATRFGKNIAGDTGAIAAFALTGGVINPMLEVLYQSPAFREFQYDFLFYPRDEREAVEVQKIINTFTYHQAPEFQEGGGIGLLTPPSEFEIKFYYSGSENKNIPQVGDCILKTIDVDYAPNGFSAYEVPGQTNAAIGGTGMPVTIRLSLRFQEITYLTKNKPGTTNQPNIPENQSQPADPAEGQRGNIGSIVAP